MIKNMNDKDTVTLLEVIIIKIIYSIFLVIETYNLQSAEMYKAK